METNGLKQYNNMDKRKTKMSYDEQRISDQIDVGLLQQKREHIKKYVKEWMDRHEPDTFVKNQHGNVIYSAGHSSLNLVAFFENLLEDYLDENEFVKLKKNCI